MKKLTIEEISQKRLALDNAQKNERFPIYVLLDNIRSLYNVGSIFRTADAARVKKIILCGITGQPPRKEIDKTALGATESVPWEYCADIVKTVKQFSEENIPILALEQTNQSKPHWTFDYPFPCCLVIGNEVYGIQDEVLEYVDSAIEIPMFGIKHSLNVSVAFGVVIYSILAKYSI